MIVLGDYSHMNRDKAMKVFMLFKLTLTLATAVANIYSSYMLLWIQLALSVVAMLTGLPLIYISHPEALDRDLVAERSAADSTTFMPLSSMGDDHDDSEQLVREDSVNE